MLIEDGKGTGYKAEVTNDNFLRTYSQMETEMSHTSEHHGGAYVWTASKDINATDSIIWLRNDSTTQNLVIECFHVSSDAAGSWFAYCPPGTTADGDTITGVNTNRSSGKVALATCRQDATGTTPANYIYYGHNIAAETVTVSLHGALVLGYLDEFAIDITTEPTVLAQATIFGYFHSIEE
jgi:hypothetical protein